MITLDPRSTDLVFGFQVSGRITRDDYRRFLPRLEEAIKEHGTIGVLVHIESLEGIELGALWEELKFDLKHCRHFDRLVLVGDKKWHERSMSLAGHLTPAEVRYFPSSDLDEAWEWILVGEWAEESSVAREDTVQSVLYATDFSENSDTALNWAITIAKAHGALLSVLHVGPVTSIANLPLGIRKESIEAQIRDAGVEVTTQWQAGRPWEVISAEAQEHDLVVIGARGHTPFQHLPLGSTADRVMRMAPAPVLIVHPKDRRFDHMPSNAVVAIDFSKSASFSLDAIVRVFAIPSGDKLNITLVHAWQPLVAYGVIPKPNTYVGTEEQATEILERLAAKVRTQSINVTPVVRQGSPATVIEEETEAIDAEFIAMGTRGYSGLARFMLGSVAERVVHRVRCPVLSINQATMEAAERARTEQIAVAAA